jgi:hypothetical protein
MNSTKLSQLGYREIAMLAELLKVYADNGCTFLPGDVEWEYNPESDNVFLVDDDGNVGMLNDDGKLEQWNLCADCSAEGFASSVPLDDSGECSACSTRKTGADTANDTINAVSTLLGVSDDTK